METKKVLRFLTPLLLLILVAAIFGAPIYADAITPSSTTYTIVEGTSTTVAFTFTNNLASIVILSTGVITTGVGDFVSGDPSDSASGQGGFSQGCLFIFANSSCTDSFTVASPSDTGETDGDSGVTEFTDTITFSDSGNLLPTETATAFVTVNDSPTTAVPEPSSALLLALGIGIAFGVYYRQHRSLRSSPFRT